MLTYLSEPADMATALNDLDQSCHGCMLIRNTDVTSVIEITCTDDRQHFDFHMVCPQKIRMGGALTDDAYAISDFARRMKRKGYGMVVCGDAEKRAFIKDVVCDPSSTSSACSAASLFDVVLKPYVEHLAVINGLVDTKTMARSMSKEQLCSRLVACKACT